MSDTVLSEPYRRLTLDRLSSSPLSASLLMVTRVLEDYDAARPPWFTDAPRRAIELSAETLTDYVQDVRRARAQGVAAVFCLTAAGAASPLSLFLEFESTPVGEICTLWFSLTEAQILHSTERLLRVVHALSVAFGAFRGAIEDQRLLFLYRGARAAARAREALPAELRQFVPEVSPPWAGDTKALELLVPQEFDRRQVPDAIWWVNYWDPVQVHTVGVERIRSAGFERASEVADGGMVMVATDDPTDPNNTAHLFKLIRIVEHLQLRTLQESQRFRGRV